MMNPTIEDIGSLEPNPYNPNRQSEDVFEMLCKSIQEDGFTQPILVHKQTRQIIDGEHRWRAARHVGMSQIPAVLVEMDPDQMRIATLRHNRARGEEEEDLTTEVFRQLEELGSLDRAQEALQMDDMDIQKILGSLETPEIEFPDLEGEEEEEEEIRIDPSAEVHSETGEIYILGPHRLMCGDCRDAGDVSALLDGRDVNVAFTSPPYASQRKYDETSEFKPIPPGEYTEWFDAVQANVWEHLAEDGSWFVNIKEHCEDGQRSLYVKDLTLAHVRRWGWRFVDEFAWTREGVPGKWPGRFKNGWEPVFHFARGAVKHRPYSVGHESDRVFRAGNIGTSRTGCPSPTDADVETGLALPSNVLKIAADKTQTQNHSATFPVALPAWFVRAFSDASDAIFDPFLGSGTTLIAAAQCGRRGYGMEISALYCDVARRRWTRWARKNNQDPGPGALEG